MARAGSPRAVAAGAETVGKDGAVSCSLTISSPVFPPSLCQIEREIQDFQLLLIPSCSQWGVKGLVSIFWLQHRGCPPVRGSPTHDAAGPRIAPTAVPILCPPQPQHISPEPPDVPPSCSGRSAQDLALQTTFPLLPHLVAASDLYFISSMGSRSAGKVL